jgi:hypothetical protein
MRTSELTGVALDWAVAKCEGATDFYFDTVATHWVKLNGKDRALRYGWAQSYLPSTDWSLGGPIIEREGLGMWMYSWNEQGEPEVGWIVEDKHGSNMQTGPTPLIAAMRCYVVSKLGADIDVPNF